MHPKILFFTIAFKNLGDFFVISAAVKGYRGYKVIEAMPATFVFVELELILEEIFS